MADRFSEIVIRAAPAGSRLAALESTLIESQIRQTRRAGRSRGARGEA